MRKKVIITDLSRMKGDRVCIFGIDEKGRAIRPDIPYSGIRESYLLNEEGQLIIKPFVEIEFGFIGPLPPKPPHTEDWEINTRYKPRLIRDLTEDEKKEFLERILYRSVKEIFGAVTHNNQYIDEGEGKRSLGTIKVKEVLYVKYSMKGEGKYEYRIKFLDMSGAIYNLPITDCAFRNYCAGQRTESPMSLGSIGAGLQQRFNQVDIFLRVGLARPFEKMYNRCYLQVSGIHTFPDYTKEL